MMTDKKPEGNYGSKVDAGYADPGFQSDKKPRYPLKKNGHYDAERVRAAWNYIHKAKNRTPYSSEDLSKIEARIVSAWKQVIDKDGPPSTQKNMGDNSMRKFIEGGLQKGLETTPNLALAFELIRQAQRHLELEATLENDNYDTHMASELKFIAEQIAGVIRDKAQHEMRETEMSTDWEDLTDGE